MDVLHVSGVDIVHGIQDFFAHHEELMLLLSRAGDPKNAFLIYFPVVYGLSHFHGRRLLWAGAFAEWLNIMFKWILFGHRPYWWVHEYQDVYGTEKVAQYHLTCETGPGSPSGHAMVTAAVYYIMIDAVKELFPKWIPHLLFLIMMLPISLSRVFIAAHFPHQVIAGTFCGAIIATLLDKYTNISRWGFKKYILTAFGLLVSCISFSWTLGQLGVDFHWTIPLAVKWCEKPKEWISLSTTPYNALARDVSVMVGFGLAEVLRKKYSRSLASSGKIHTFLSIVLSLLTVNALEAVQFDHPTELSFYMFSALKHTLIPVIVSFIVPCLPQIFFSSTKKKTQ